MKKFVFLMLTCSSFMAFACAEDPESVGGPVTDGYSSSGNMLSGGLSSNSSNGASINSDCWGPVIATGFVYFSIQRLVIGISYALNGGGGGGGGDNVEVDQNLNCSSSHSGKRFDAATAVFKVAMLKAMKPGGIGRIAFCREYPTGSTFTFEFPNGKSADYRVFSCTPSFRPLSLEIANSCG